ncbi:MAG: T9SS type A sorting domain-containing protein, partial [Ignavibacteriaceae bacterium]|nr:T9SS type A sorting domain-containing protein [Ignavibacteriaceae bacterium]
GNLPVGIVYQKNNSIYIFTKNDSVESNREVIQGSDSLKYSSPSAMYDYVYYSNEWNYPAIRITAIQTDNLQNQRIIEKDISLSSNIDTTFIVDEGDVNNPHFITNNSFYLSYDKSENQRTSVYSFNGYPDKFILNDTLNGDFSNFQNENTVRPIIDKASSYNFVDIYPYIYNYQSNDSNFIGASSGVNSLKDTLIFTRVKSPKSAIEYVAYQQLLNKEENYLVWEDSLNGNIKLFTHKMLVPVYGDVKTTNTPSVFQLYQNYPNPFNPSTTISYEIPKSGLVQLKIYDVLGREITALVNEMQPAGRHFVVFNSKQVNKELSSGIYLYRLRFGNNMVSNKMILVK